jgi:membrane-bound ClpP family serine protease
MKTILLVLVAGFILFELMEHVVLPLIWSIKDRKKESVCGVTGMLGKMAEVKQWDKREGQVFVNGELWQAVSDDALFAGDKTVVQDVKGLTLKVKSLKNSSPGLYL